MAVATLHVAVGFRPLRSRIQDVVDRRFRTARYEFASCVRARTIFATESRASEQIVPVLADALQDPLAQLLFWIPR